VMVDAALDAPQGARTSSRASPVDLRTLMVLYPNRMHVVSIDGTGVEKMSRSQGQARLHRLARQRHRGDGVSPDRGGWPRQGQGHAARAARCRRIRQHALKDRKIDAFFWVGGLPTAAVTDLGANPQT